MDCDYARWKKKVTFIFLYKIKISIFSLCRFFILDFDNYVVVTCIVTAKWKKAKYYNFLKLSG